MWEKAYHDYKRDESNIKNPVESGRGIHGCEMHEINGWGNTIHHPQKQKTGWLITLMSYILGNKLP